MSTNLVSSCGLKTGFVYFYGKFYNNGDATR
ncbi:hypothetical protein SAMN05444126_1571, partial [Salisediminibacterium halotolerans]